MMRGSLERISGPVWGHYLATYAVPVADGYQGYAKICSERPPDVWECEAMEKVGGGTQRSWRMAVADAERRAVLYLELMHQYYALDDEDFSMR